MSTSVLYDAPGPKARRRQFIFNIIGAFVVAGGIFWLFWTLGQPKVTQSGQVVTGMFDPSRWDIFSRPEVWQGIWMGVSATLSAAGVAAVLAIIFGVVMSLLVSSQSKWIRIPVTILLEFFRGMPVLLMMLFLLLLVFSRAPFWAVVIALVLYNGTLIGEILRAGLKSLPRGQREAGLTIGLSGLRTRFLIEFPQAFRQMTPVIVAQLVVLLKDTSLGYIVTYEELLKMVKNMQSYYGDRYLISLFFVALAIYLTINMLVSAFAKYLSRRMTQTQQKRQIQGGHDDDGMANPDAPGSQPLPPTTSVIGAVTGR